MNGAHRINYAHNWWSQDASPFSHNGLYLIRFDKRIRLSDTNTLDTCLPMNGTTHAIHDAKWCKRRALHSMALHKLKWPTHLKEQRTDQEVMISVSHVTRLTQSTRLLGAAWTNRFHPKLFTPQKSRWCLGWIRSVTVSRARCRRCCCPNGSTPTAIILFLNEFSCRFAVWDTTCIVASGRYAIWASWTQRGSLSDDSHCQETKLRVDDSLILCSALLLLFFFVRSLHFGVKCTFSWF